MTTMSVRLGNVQLRIMRVLWDEGEATAKRVTEVLNANVPIAHSTVQTLIRQLEAKQAVTHEKRERTFIYRPALAESEVTRSAAQDLLARVYQGSLAGLVAHLLEEEEVDADELSRLRGLIEAKEREVRP